MGEPFLQPIRQFNESDLPTVATLLLVVVFGRIKEQDGLFEIGFDGKIDKSAAENLRMEQARYPALINRNAPFCDGEAAEQADAQSLIIDSAES